MRVPFVDLSRQYAAQAEELDDAVRRVMRSGRYILGDEVAAFEAEMARYLSCRYAITVGSGTDALTLAVRVLAPEVVILPAMTFVASASAVVRGGAVPVFADIDPVTGMLTAETVAAVWPDDHERAAVMPVHLYGAACPMGLDDEIMRIEDTAEALGATFPDGRYAGTVGTMGCFSFVPTKNLGGCGDGGMIVARSPDDAAQLRALRDHGRITHSLHHYIGDNSRLDEIQAAILRVRLPLLDQWNRRRAEIQQIYRERLAAYSDVVHWPVVEGTGVYQVCVILVPPECRSWLYMALMRAGIEAKYHYPRIVPDQPAYRRYRLPGQTFPHASVWASRCLTLPNFPLMTSAEVDYVADMVVHEVKGWH